MQEYLKNTDDTDFVQGLYETLVQPAANFLDSYIDSTTKLPHASYDLWEEKYGSSTYTAASVYGALHAAAEFSARGAGGILPARLSWQAFLSEVIPVGNG